MEAISPEDTPVDEVAVSQSVLPPIEYAAVSQPFPSTLSPVQPSLHTKEKCHSKGCPGLHRSPHNPVTACFNDECSKLVHRICYEKMLSKSKKARTAHSTAVFCTFSCQDKYDKSLSTSHLHWRNDGKNGPEDPEHSEHYIVQWLLNGDNFSTWRSPPSGQTKLKVAERIASLLNTYGLRRDFTAQMVYNKIAHIEGQMRSTYDWCSGSKTGVGLKESDPLSFNEKVSSLLYYFRIL